MPAERCIGIPDAGLDARAVPATPARHGDRPPPRVGSEGLPAVRRPRLPTYGCWLIRSVAVAATGSFACR